MIVAGIMSGTSADGIDVAITQILGRGYNCKLQLLAHQHFDYADAVRKVVLAAMNAEQASVADLARLNFLLGELYAEATAQTIRRNGFSRLDLIGCHGQTLYHQGTPALFLSKQLMATWQSGEGAVLAARTGVPVISDFRPADIAAGGKGAPLVPFFDYVFYRSRKVSRVLQNIGGIANLTLIPAGAAPDQVIAFDTGPGNMVIDACMQRFYGKPYDKNGAIAAKGTLIHKVVTQVLREPFFQRKPPKTAGREEFGREFVARFIRLCGRTRKENVIATATALTARSVTAALRVLRRPQKPGEYIVAGGGARNRTLMAMIADEVEPLGLHLRSSEEFGIPVEAKEAAAFALLAYQTWHRQPANLGSATGAKRNAILGKISYPPL